MGLIEDVALLGADTNDGMTRCMGKPELYERMLKKLPKVVEEAPVMPYVQSGDTEIVNLFRDAKPEKATELLAETLKIQQSFLDCIKKYE